MNSQNPVVIERLIALVAEAEDLVTRNFTSHDIRQACAVARGYLELARSYGEPVSIEDVERIVARVRKDFAGLTDRSGESAARPPDSDCAFGGA